MKKAAAIALLITLPAPARAQRVVDLQAARLQVADGGVEHVDGGVWLDDAKTISVAKDLAQLRAENEHLAKHAGDMPTAWVVGAFIVGAALGAGVTAFALTRR